MGGLTGVPATHRRTVAVPGFRPRLPSGLPEEYSIHCARHTLAVHLLKKTGNLRQVQKQLGHTSLVTTANMYADVSDEDIRPSLLDRGRRHGH